MDYSSPPMQLGEVLRGTDDGTTTGNLINDDWLGRSFTFPAYPGTGGPTKSKSILTGRSITAVLLRNTSSLTLLGKRLGQLSRTAGYKTTKEVDGYSAILANKGVVLIDPFLPSGGVADKSIFWGVYSGPALCLLPLLGSDHTADIAVNDPLVAATGTTTAVTTSGRITHTRAFVASDNNSVNMSLMFNQIYGCVGRAMSARTSQETTAGADLLVDFSIRLFGENR